MSGPEPEGAFPPAGAEEALWHATAVPTPATARLTGEICCEVAIIGAGFTGLNAALHLAGAGTGVCVLEQGDLGYGSSGRSGGQVNLGLNLGPAALLQKFGSATGERMIETVIHAPQSVFDTVRSHQLDCDAVQAGWVQAAATPAGFGRMQAVSEEYAKFGVQFDVLDRSAVHCKTGTSRYVGGLFCASAGSLHPLSYTRELARVAMNLGARVYTRSAVTGIDRDAQGWLLLSAQGRLRAKTVLLCTNAYGNNTATSLKKKWIPVRSILSATEPLSPG